MSPRQAAAALTVLLLLLLSNIALAPLAHADGAVPFTDPNAQGSVGLCDKDGRPLLSGNIKDVPFAFKAVSTQAAPKAYQVKGRTATLMAFSALQGLAPGDWTSYTMIQSTFYTDPRSPVAVADYNQPPLIYQTTGAPPLWDGLIQLRLIYGAPDNPPLDHPYPAAVIRVSGSTWTLVQGDKNPPCASATGRNLNSVVADPSRLRTAPPTTAANASPAPSKASASADPSSSSASAAPTESLSSTSGDAGADTTASQGAAGSRPMAGVLVVVVAGMTGLALIGGLVWALLARRRP